MQRLGTAVEALEGRSNVSSNCQKDLDALSQAAGQTIDLGAIQSALSNTDFKNGVTSTLPVSALAGPSLDAYGNALQNDRDGKYGPGQTILDDFARNPKGLTAETVLGGRTIFINANLIGGNLTGNEGLLFHEALHELGLIDQQIQQALGFKDYNDVSNTKRNFHQAYKGLHNRKGKQLKLLCPWVIVVCAIAPVANSQALPPVPPAPESANVIVFVSETFGRPVPGARITLTSVVQGEKFTAIGGNAVFSRVPFGIYLSKYA